MTLLTLLRTLSLGYFGRHLVRTTLVMLLIALGVAVLVATQALNRGLKVGVQDGVNPVAKLADLLIVNGETGIPGTLADELSKANIEGVEAITPFVFYRVSLVDLQNKVVWLIGVQWEDDKDQSKVDASLGVNVEVTWKPNNLLEAGSLLLFPPVLVSENLAKDLAESRPKTQRFRIRNAGFTPEVTRVGTIGFSGSSLPLKESSVVLMKLADASRICFPERAGYVTQLIVKTKPGERADVVRQRLKEALAGRATVQTVEDSRQIISDVTAGLEIGLTIGSAGALVVGLFLVYLVLSVTVTERRHDIGILRSVGATRMQIAWLFVGEAAVMGLIGSASGLPLGYGLAHLAIGPMSGVISDLLVPVDGARVELPLWISLLALVIGTFVAITAALIPAMRASSEEPADAVRRVPQRDPKFLGMAQVVFSLVLIVAGVLFAMTRQALPSRFGVFAGVVCLLLGILVLTPLLTTLVGRVLQPLFRYILGLEGRLAADNLVRSPGRTGLVIAALAATGGLLFQTAGFLKSTRESIVDWIEEKIAADLFVTSGSPATAGGAALTMREDFEKQLRSLSEVETLMTVRFNRLEYANPLDGQERIVFLVALDTQAFLKTGATERPLAKNLANFPEMKERGTAVISENFAYLYQKKVGDTITITGRNGPLDLRVVGVVVDYSWNRGTILVDRSWYREDFEDRQVSIFDVFLKPGSDVAAFKEKLLKLYGEEQALFVISRKELYDEFQDSLNKVYALAYAQQFVIGIVAMLGVVCALSISVMQRRRELGLLRAVGATRGQILRSVLAEAALMGLVGAIVGLVIGVVLEWYVIHLMLRDESGFAFAMRIPWFEAGLVTLASVVFACIAGLGPALHATQVSIPEAIAYE
jgi:putative ABC transport system permease protein